MPLGHGNSQLTINSLVDGAVIVVLGSSFGPSGGSRAKQIMTSEPSPSQWTINCAWESLSELCWRTKRDKQKKEHQIMKTKLRLSWLVLSISSFQFESKLQLMEFSVRLKGLYRISNYDFTESFWCFYVGFIGSGSQTWLMSHKRLSRTHKSQLPHKCSAFLNSAFALLIQKMFTIENCTILSFNNRKKENPQQKRISLIKKRGN